MKWFIETRKSQKTHGRSRSGAIDDRPLADRCDEWAFATLDWVSWYNKHRSQEPIGDIPPAEFEQMCDQNQTSDVTACMLAKSPFATLYTRGFGDFVTSITAPIATGWSDSCRVGFAPTEDRRLFTAHCRVDDWRGGGRQRG